MKKLALSKKLAVLAITTVVSVGSFATADKVEIDKPVSKEAKSTPWVTVGVIQHNKIDNTSRSVIQIKNVETGVTKFYASPVTLEARKVDDVTKKADKVVKAVK